MHTSLSGVPDSGKAVSLMTALREKTDDAHRRLEQGLDMLGPDLDLARYMRLVAAFDRFLGAWEEQLVHALPPDGQAFFASRRHSERTHQDLERLEAAFGRPALDEALRDLPVRCDTLPDLRDAASAWGSAYVIEGSTLGGRVISRHLSTVLPLTPESGAGYFAGYGASTGTMWADFRRTIETNVDPSQHQRAVDAARETFDALHRWMQRCALA